MQNSIVHTAFSRRPEGFSIYWEGGRILDGPRAQPCLNPALTVITKIKLFKNVFITSCVCWDSIDKMHILLARGTEFFVHEVTFDRIKSLVTFRMYNATYSTESYLVFVETTGNVLGCQFSGSCSLF